MTISASYDAAYGPDCQLRWQDRADIDFVDAFDIDQELLSEQDEYDSITAQLLFEQMTDDEAVADLIASGEAR
jgi:hypothetical protein